jgi:hypothetical protein
MSMIGIAGEFVEGKGRKSLKRRGRGEFTESAEYGELVLVIQ